MEIHCAVATTETTEERSLHLPFLQHHAGSPDNIDGYHQHHGHGHGHSPEEGPAGVADPGPVVEVGGGLVPTHRAQDFGHPDRKETIESETLKMY